MGARSHDTKSDKVVDYLCQYLGSLSSGYRLPMVQPLAFCYFSAIGTLTSTLGVSDPPQQTRP